MLPLGFQASSPSEIFGIVAISVGALLILLLWAWAGGIARKVVALIGAILSPLVLPILILIAAMHIGIGETLALTLAVGLPFVVGETLLWFHFSESRSKHWIFLGYLAAYPALLLALWVILFVGLKIKIA